MPTILIAAPAHLPGLKQRGELSDALAFPDHDALRAFDAIARQRADVVVLESAFASTSRGAALISRIKADPLLRDCDVRIVTPDDESGVPAPPASASAPPASAPAPPAPASAPPASASAPPASAPAPPASAPAPPASAPAPPASAPAPPAPAPAPRASASAPPPAAADTPLRFDTMSGVELLVEGTVATLVDLSTGGAQVMSATSLKPHQRVRLTLPGSPPLRLNGEITWAVFEMPAGAPRYRAGVAFVDPNVDAIAAFIENARRGGP